MDAVGSPRMAKLAKCLLVGKKSPLQYLYYTQVLIVDVLVQCYEPHHLLGRNSSRLAQLAGSEGTGLSVENVDYCAGLWSYCSCSDDKHVQPTIPGLSRIC